MTNEQKKMLRYCVKNEPPVSAEELADDIGCAVSTARKYQKVFAPKKATQ